MPKFSIVPGEYGKRVVAYLLDFLYVILPPVFAIAIGVTLLISSSLQPLGPLLLVLSVGWLLFAGLWNDVAKQGTTGQTVGKAKMSLALVKATTGENVGVGRAFLRLTLIWFFNSITLGVFLFVDLLAPLFNQQKQRLVDMMLNTMVVDTAASPPINQRFSPQPLASTSQDFPEDNLLL